MSPKTRYNIKTCGLALLLLVPLYPVIATIHASRLSGCILTAAGRRCHHVANTFGVKIPGAKRYADWVYKKVDSVKKPVDS